MRAKVSICFILLGLTALAQTNPIPLLNQPLLPTTVAPGGPEFRLTVDGTGFVAGAVVNWNGVGLDTTFLSSSQLAATVPASNIIAAATAAITVTNPSPGGGVSNPVFFPVSAPAASVFFTNTQVLATGASPSCIAVGDFNRDGNLDLAVANSGSATVSVFLGNGDGTFQLKVDYPTVASATGVTVADFRGDGMLDLAVASFGEISILLGNGDGTFQTHVDYPGYDCGGFSCELVGGTILAADFNGDGKPDLATSYGVVEEPAERHKVKPPMPLSGGFTSVFLGNGDGTFQPYINTSSDPAGGSLAAGDFNNDGNIDLASSLNPATGDDDLTAVVALGSGHGTFSTSYEQDVGLWDIEMPAVAAADLNGDGNLDFVACSAGGGATLLGNGDGTFQVTMAPGGAACPVMVFGDFHGNGFLDLATVYGISAGNGTGIFSYSKDEQLPGGKMPVWVAVADFNGDGKLDAVVADKAAGAILVDLQSGNAVLSPASLSLSSYIGITSAPQAVTLANTYGAGLAISGIAVSTGFAQTSNCPVGGSLPPKSSCTIEVTFTPTTSNTVSGTLSVSDDGPSSPQIVALTGTVSSVTLTPNSLSLLSYIGTTSALQSVTLSNPSSEALAISAITASASFAETNNCPIGGSLPSGSSCIIKVTFSPTAPGAMSGMVSITDDGLGSPQMIGLTGTVQDFAIAASSQTSVTVTPGEAANYSANVSPINGFNQTVELSCSGAPAQSTCTVTPASVTIAGSKAVAANIAVVTTAATMALTKPYGSTPAASGLETWSAAWGWLALVVLSGLVGWRKRSPRWICGPAFLCLMVWGFVIAGCGGSSSNGGGGTGGTAAGTYNLTITGTFKSGSTTLTHSTKVVLIVQ